VTELKNKKMNNVLNDKKQSPARTATATAKIIKDSKPANTNLLDLIRIINKIKNIMRTTYHQSINLFKLMRTVNNHLFSAMSVKKLY
jgi:hypothetical protein